jgi:Uma2 family endonuclease
MSLLGPRFTYDDYKYLPEDKRYEIIEGDLHLTPSPSFRHQAIQAELLFRLMAFVKKRGLGQVVAALTDVILSPENVVQPDLLFIGKDRLSMVKGNDGVRGAPDLVIEILSPSTAGRDQVLKRKLYSKYGVREYWIVDPDGSTVEVLTQASSGLETWRVFPVGTEATSPLLQGFSLPVTQLFSP